MDKPSPTNRLELRSIRRSIHALIVMARDDKGPLEYVSGREQTLESAQHLELCLDAMIREIEASTS